MVINTNLLSPPECHGTLRGVKWSCIAEGPSEGSPVPVVQGASDSFARCQEWGRITGTLRLLEEKRYKRTISHKDVYTVNILNSVRCITTPKYSQVPITDKKETTNWKPQHSGMKKSPYNPKAVSILTNTYRNQGKSVWLHHLERFHICCPLNYWNGWLTFFLRHLQ